MYKMDLFMKIMQEIADKGEQCLQDMDKWYQDFEAWRDCISDDLERLKTQKNSKAKVVPVIPLTPAASSKKKTRRKLSTVPELFDFETGNTSVETENTSVETASTSTGETASTSAGETASISAGEKLRRRAVKNANIRNASAQTLEEENKNGPLRRSKRARITRENSSQGESAKESAPRSRGTYNSKAAASNSRDFSGKKDEEVFAVPNTVPEEEKLVQMEDKPLDKAVRSSANKQKTKVLVNEEVEETSAGKEASASKQVSAGKASASKASTGKASTGKASTGKASASKASAGKASASKASAGKASASKACTSKQASAGNQTSASKQSSADEHVILENIEIHEAAENLLMEAPKGESDDDVTSDSRDRTIKKEKTAKRSLHVLCKRLSKISNKSSRRVTKVRQSSRKSSRPSNQRMTRQTLKKLSQASNKKSIVKPTMSSGKPSESSEENGQKQEMEIEEIQNHDEQSIGNEEKMETNGSDDESNYCSADEGTSIVKTNKSDGTRPEVVSSDEIDETTKPPGSIPAEVPGKNHFFTKPANTKSPALFSPYANEPVKNRVAAYETLHAVPEEAEKAEVTPVRMTRTKTRALAAKAGVPKNEEMQKATKGMKKIEPSNSVAKENCAPPLPKYVTGSKLTPSVPSKVLSQNNSLLSQSTARKTPMSNSALLSSLISSSTGQINKLNNKPGVILSNVHTFIKKKTKPVQDLEIQKMEEQRKRQEKAKEAQRRKEEFLKKKAEEQKKKWDEKRMKVLQNREAQEREKQESQIRLGKEKTEKMNNLLQEREAKQKEEILQKKLEAERKAAEARRKHEEAEAARIAKLKLQEEQHKKEQEESEMQRQGVKRAAEEKEAAAKREKIEPPAVLAVVKQVDTIQVPPKENLNSTFTKSNSNLKVNMYNLNEIDTDESSSDESSHTKNTAPWATKHRLLHKSELELGFHELAERFFACPKGPMDLRKIFNSHVKRDYKRTSSAIWHTPPRYSQLPKY